MKDKGFTLIEIIISIFILSIAVVGIFSAFSIIVILTSDSADRLTATYLAQEGMEIVRNIRDANWLVMDNNNCTHGDTACGHAWTDGLTVGACASATGCQADYASTSMSGSSGGYLSNANGFYNYESGTATKFQRKIIITQDGDHILRVIVEVSWKQKASIVNLNPNAGVLNGDCEASNCVTTEETLYNWY